MVSNSRPPSAGPSIRVPLVVAESSPMAGPRRSGPAISPSMVRRTGNSVVHSMPLRNAPVAICHISMRPAKASAASVPETATDPISAPTNRCLRLTCSATAPVTEPNRNIGRARATIINAT